MRVKMVRCTAEYVEPPEGPSELEAWCKAGKSGRPIQNHLGDEETVLWVNDNGSLCVAFDDDDERILFKEESQLQPDKEK